jgi:hypothetical protein
MVDSTRVTIRIEDNQEVNIYIDRERVFKENGDGTLTRLFVYLDRTDNIVKVELPDGDTLELFPDYKDRDNG